MYRHPLFIFLFILVFVIAVLHIIAIELFLYWTYSWFDILMHFLGGLFIGLSALWFFFESGYIKMHRSYRQAFIVVGVSIVLVGVGWEIFEFLADVPREVNYVADTIVDLIMDLLGALLGCVAFTKIFFTDESSL